MTGRVRRLTLAAVTAILLGAQPAAAQSVLRDAETEAMFQQLADPLIVAAGLSPHNVKVVLLNDPEINAFTAGGQTVYVNSGLLQAADNANQVQGVVAHELGHVADGHVMLANSGMRPALGIQILSMVLGLAAMAAGSGDAGAGLMAMGQSAALGKYLAFSRVQESTADATGAKFLRQANISGKGMIAFFKKLQNEEYAYGLKNIDPYMQTHPLSGDRIQTLQADLQASPAWNNPPDRPLEERFKRVKAKLEGYVLSPDRTLRDYPLTDTSVYAHYARAYAYHKAGYPDKAAAESEALVRADASDPYFLEIQGQILLEAGQPQASLTPLRKAVEGSHDNPLIATTLGHALIATEKKANLPEAIKVLRTAVGRDDDNPFAWYQLGMAYEASGDSARAALATAEQASLTGDVRTAGRMAYDALANLPPNSTDWIRAQDIAIASQNEIDDNPKKYKKRR